MPLRSRSYDAPHDHGAADRHFERLYREWRGVVWSAARPILPCDSDADDAAQRVFARLWERVSKDCWSDIARPKEYFRQAGHRESLRILHERRKVSPLTHELVKRLTSGGPTPEREAARAELRVIQRRLINELPRRCREVMQLTVYDGLTHVEVAEALRIDVGAVEKQVTRAYKHLRKRLAAMLSVVISLACPLLGTGGVGQLSILTRYKRWMRLDT